MVKLNRIYTRTGDDGCTNLMQPERIPKYAPRIETLGSVDELNSSLGVLLAALAQYQAHCMPALTMLKKIQNQLFNLGAEIAMQTVIPKPSTPCVTDADVTEIEESIDSMNSTLAELQSFILPQGNSAIAQVHMCRSICRRCERRAAELHAHEPLRAATLRYLNRLSDWLFVLARHLSSCLDIDETLWKPNQGEIGE